MSGRIESALQRWLAEARSVIGEIQIESRGDRFLLRHRLDSADAELTRYHQPEDAIEISRWDEAGAFRPLKSAPNLRRGWVLEVADIQELRLALDYFYPAMPGTALALQEQRLQPVMLRETLQRQSGMYAVAKKISDAEADAVIAGTCRSNGGCLKTILWQIDRGRPVRSLPAEKFSQDIDQFGGDSPHIPLPCSEPCNLLVAAIRSAVKKNA